MKIFLTYSSHFMKMKNCNKKRWRIEKQREDRRWSRNIQIWVVSRSQSSLSFVFRSLQNFHLLLFSLSLFLSPTFPFMIPSAASIENPPVSYYSPIVRHCTHRTKHHGDSLLPYPLEIFGNIRMNDRPKKQPGKGREEGR